MKLIIAMSCAAALLLIASAAARASEYTVSELPVPPGFTMCNSSRINDLGQIVGGCWVGSPNTERAVLWENGIVIILPLPAGFASSWASSVSSTGQIVGYSQGATGFKAMLWSNGRVQNLGVLPGTLQSYASDINASGVIVGFSDNEAVEWVGGQILDFGGYNGVRPAAISDRGVFVGFGMINSGDIGGAIIDVGTPGAPLRYLAESALGAAYDINGDDEVVGFNRTGANAPDVPWTWHYGRFTYLPFLTGSTSCIPSGINDLGQIVGLCGYGEATLWQRGAVVDLNALIQKKSGWVLNVSNSINAAGDITGDGEYGGNQEAFILKPTRPALTP